MLKIHHSNRMERLADALADLLATPGDSPFAPEFILIQSNGMRRWVAMELARRAGIAANLQFPYPATFLWSACRAVLPEVPDTSPFDKEILSWRLLQTFEELEDAPVYAPLRHYLQDADVGERYHLARRIADLFDQYLVYRPDWITAWEAGEQDHWQAALWRRLAATTQSHRAHLHQIFIDRLKKLRRRPAGLPARLACIGVSSLPQTTLDALFHLARFCEIHLFLLNPCRHYWGLILAEREIARLNTESEAEFLYQETGNRLLASLGRQGRDFHHLIAEIDAEPQESFEDIAADNLLHCLQADMLDLHNRGRNHQVCRFDTWSQGIPATPLNPDDRSLQIHVCHSATREVEVLHDQLLDLFARHPPLKATDVVVMTPDIAACAPAIRAVFGTREPRIPFGIADQGLRAASPVVDALLQLLDLQDSRFDVNRVSDLLETPPVHGRFGLDADDLGRIGGWLQATTVRWGIDAAGRAALDLPGTHEHTWRAGLRRLLLGFALPAGDRRLYGDILPFDAVEGDGARSLGKLQRFASRLFALQAELAGHRTITAWGAVLRQVLDDFIAADEVFEADREQVRAALDQLETAAGQAGFTGEVPLIVVRSWLERHLEAETRLEGFLSDGVTFCAMVPMRSIPFQVVCLIGLNDGSYPRRQDTVDFDLMARNPRRGDRSRRQDDRYLFLEALLSARAVLYLSYVGSSIRDNSPIPPSVLVNELLDYIRQGFHPPGDPHGDAAAAMVTRHPLQPFSPRYFEPAAADTRVFSFSQILCAAARVQGQGRADRQPRFLEPLPEPEPDNRQPNWRDLSRFFSNPSRYLLQQRLQIRLEDGAGRLEDREPFELDRLDGRSVRQTLFDLQRDGRKPGEILPLVQAQGLLPHGAIGRSVYFQELGKLKPLLRIWQAEPPPAAAPLEVNLTLGAFAVTGWLPAVGTAGLVDFSAHSLRGPAWLDLWIRHLILNCLRPAGVARESVCHALDGSLQLVPVAEPETRLLDLLDLYWEGLCRPLKLFPRSGLEYMKAGPKQDPLREALAQWQGSKYHWGESQDPYHQLLFGHDRPIDAEFENFTRRVFEPLFAHRRERCEPRETS